MLTSSRLVLAIVLVAALSADAHPSRQLVRKSVRNDKFHPTITQTRGLGPQTMKGLQSIKHGAFTVQTFGTFGTFGTVVEDYVDKVLAKVRDQIIENGLDNIELPEYKIAISDDIYAALEQGFFRGLETLNRTGPVDLQNDNGKLTVNTNMGISDINLGYAAHIQFTIWHLETKMPIDISYANADIEIVTDIAGAEKEVTHFKISDIGYIDLKYEDLGGFWEWVIDTIAEPLVNALKMQIASLLDEPIMKLIQEGMNNIGKKA